MLAPRCEFMQEACKRRFPCEFMQDACEGRWRRGDSRHEERAADLLINPDTPQQRALWTGDGERLDHRRFQLEMARARHGRAASLGWLRHSTQQITEA